LTKRLLHNRYELLEEIGDGGTAVVYKARCTLLDRIVAVKILKEELARDQAFVRKFRSEAQAAAQLSHPNIVNVYDVGEENGLHFIVMEYVEGVSLKKYLEEHGPLTPQEAVRIAVLICGALEQAHHKGIIHRDIKPHNILMTSDGSIKVADFGIARASNSSTITYSGNIMGSVHYISPEQARGTAVGATTDIYSLGCLMYEMLTGKVPFDAESPITVALKHIHEEPVPLRAINSAIPPKLERIVLKAMAKDPHLRFRTATEMKQALMSLSYSGQLIEQEAGANLVAAPAFGTEGDGEIMSAKRRKMKPIGKLVVLVALIGLLAGLVYGLRGQFFGKEVVVPSVEGYSTKEAYEKLAEVGLKMTKVGEEYNDEVEAGCVVTQDPAPGKKVKEGREVRVILSKGPEMVRVPDLTGSAIADARLELTNVGLRMGNIEYVFDQEVPEGVIISQEPRANQRLKVNEKVDVAVSKGPQPNQIQVPSLIGLYLDDAKNHLVENKLVLGSISERESLDYFPGQVIAQTPGAGTMVTEGQSVDLVASKGPGPLPRTVPLTFSLPEDQDFYKVVVKVNDAKGVREAESNVYVGGDEVNLSLTCYGKAIIEVYLDGTLYKRYSA